MLGIWTTLFGFFVGAAAGSFVNVLVWRLPRNQSINNPKWSYCPNCKARLTLLDLFPLLSFLFSRARCRHCGKPIAWRYFWVEIMCASLWAGLWYQNMVIGWQPAVFLAYALFATALVAIVFIDIEFFLIPDELNTWLLLCGIGLGVYFLVIGDLRGWQQVGSLHLPAFLVGMVAGTAILWLIAFLGRILFRKDAMGHGDIKMARGMGALLPFPFLVASIGLAIAFGAVIGVILLILLGNKSEPEVAQEAPEEENPKPEPVGVLLVALPIYLLCLDAITTLIPPLMKPLDGVTTRLIKSVAPGWEPPSEDPAEDDWKPTASTIPFGPWLAAGALCAMLLAGPIETGVRAYIRWATGG